MNHGLPSPGGVGLAAPNDPRLMSRLAQPHHSHNHNHQHNHHHNNMVSYINNKPPQMTTISRLVPSANLSAGAAALGGAVAAGAAGGGGATTITTSSFLTSAASTTATNSSSQGAKGGGGRNAAVRLRFTPPLPTTIAPKVTTITNSQPITTSTSNFYSNTPANKNKNNLGDNNSEKVEIIGIQSRKEEEAEKGQGEINNTTHLGPKTSHSPANIVINNSGDSSNINIMRKGPQLKIKSRPKKNQSFDTNETLVQTPPRTSTPSQPADIQQKQQPQHQHQQQQRQETKPKPTILLRTPPLEKKPQLSPLTKSTIIPPTTPSSHTPKVGERTPKLESLQVGTKPIVCNRPSPLSNIIRHLPAFQSSPSSTKPLSSPKTPTLASITGAGAGAATTTTTTTSPATITKQPAPETQSATKPATASISTPSPSPSPSTTTNTSTSLVAPSQTQNIKIDAMPELRPQEAPRANGTTGGTQTNGHSVPPLKVPQSPKQSRNSPSQSSPSPNNLPQKAPSLPTSFSWDIYLERLPAPVAPKEAFSQDRQVLRNQFKPGMKLEARDPRNSSTWCLATIHMMEGLRLKLRFDGGDSMNDFFELVNSENIRPVNSVPLEPLLPPMAFKGSLSTYPKFVEKILIKSDTEVAPPEYFLPPPGRPEKNLFKAGMKLEAIDKKNPYLICPATVGEVNGDDVKILFDGWRGSFDYLCKYYSRDIFPVNWCRDNKHYIAAPNGWESLISNSPPKTGRQASRLDRLSASSPKVPSKLSPPSRTPTKEAHLAKVQLLPKNSPLTSPASKTQARITTPPKPHQTGKITTPKVREGKRKVSASPEPEPVEEAHPQDIPEDDVPDSPEVIELDCDGAPGNKFQCQRTVPYDEWVKAHRMADTTSVPTPPSSGTNTATSDKRPSADSSATIEDPSVSVSNSDSISMASTSTVAEALVSEPTVRRGRPSKKIKLDAEVDRMNIGLPAGPYTSWTINQVLNIIRLDETLAKYSTIFENHEIDGKAFGLLTTDVMINHMGLKIGPVLKIAELIVKVKGLRRFEPR